MDQFKIEFLKGNKKAGGQNLNKRETACRITHVASGISEFCQDQRNQKQNKDVAMARLQEKLKIARENAKIRILKERFPPNPNIIKTYNWKRGTVMDHRTGKTSPLNDVLEGKLDKPVSDMV